MTDQAPAPGPVRVPKPRPKTGCITCRVRKKRCDEGKPKCETCIRLGLDCLGYGDKRPKLPRNDADGANGDLKKLFCARRRRKAPMPSKAAASVTEPEVTAASPATALSTPSNIWDLDLGSVVAGPSSSCDTQSFQSWALDPAFTNAWQALIADPGESSSSPSFDAVPQAVRSDSDAQYPPFPLPALPGPSSWTEPLESDTSSVSGLGYLHHYLNAVLPLQYQFSFKAISELVAPLAMSNSPILNSVSSLAALHLVSQRRKGQLGALEDRGDDLDMVVAKSSHEEAINRLRFLTSKDLTSEDVVIATLFAISFYLFAGGTSKEWVEVYHTSRRCLTAALASSPEIQQNGFGPAPMPTASPWQRYRPLIAVMCWIDIVGSVTLNRASTLLPTYRRLLTRHPGMSASEPKLSMQNVMGCDNTTLLALAETVHLSEWKERTQDAGCLSLWELVQRGSAIEKLLEERTWREGLLDEGRDEVEDQTGPTSDLASPPVVRLMSDVWFATAKVYLMTVVNGPFARVPEVASAIADVISALNTLHARFPDANLNRALILPITLTGCVCDSPGQQEFLAGLFHNLRPDATSFGNSRQAVALMERVWEKRVHQSSTASGGPPVACSWRGTMVELGWQAGMLLV